MRIRTVLAPALAVGLLAGAGLASSQPPCALATTVSSAPVPASCRLTLVGALDLADGGLGQVAVHGDLAALVLRDAGRVALVDLADPTAPTLLGTYDGGTGQPQLDHPLDGDVAFSRDGTLLFHARQTSDWSNEGLHVLDVTDPTAPVRTDLAPQGGMLRVATAVVDGRELVATLDATHGLTIFEAVRTPLGARAVPVFVDALPALKVGGPASGGLEFLVDDPVTGGALLVAADGTTGLQLYDVTDPSDVAVVGAWSDAGLAAVAVELRAGRRLVHAATEYWFDASTPPELVTLDTTDPGAITVVARRSLGYDGALAWKLGGLHLDGDELLVAHGHAGLAALDPVTGTVVRSTTDLGTRDGLHPTYTFLGWYAMDVASTGDHVLVTDAVTGELRVLQRD